ncbi:MAG: hypothetical protein IJZ35_01265 [Clostridia bacterium]|nr:hypothetical protein [Clostridia bacterium]
MKKQFNKIKKFIKISKGTTDIIYIFLTAVFITIALLILVCLFEQWNIHVPGSREMWIGLIGALLGGVYTMLGVKMTINYQSKVDNEKDRLSNIPILKFETGYSTMTDFNGDGIFSIDKNSIYTTAFPQDETKPYPTLTISLANNNSAFDIYIESFVTLENMNNSFDREFFFPQEYRLVSNEKVQYMLYVIDYEKYSCSNVLGVVRIAYSDIFGNAYYQDVAVAYYEDIESLDNLLEIEHIRMPILKKDALDLSEIIKIEYGYLHTENIEEQNNT